MADEPDPWAPPPADWRPAAPPEQPPYGAPPGWQPPAAQYPPHGAPPYGAPPQYPPYGAPAGWQPSGGPPGQPPPYGWAPPYAPPSNTNGFAIASLVVSILGGWLPFIGAVLAIIFGIVGLNQTRARGERGRGLAIAGLAIGVAGLLFWIAVFVLAATGGSSGSSTTV